jgi:pimeloyl-ACP methyl ester carboxylesterase
MDRRLCRPSAGIAFADTQGDGVPVVLTHGAGLDSRMFDEQVEALASSGYRVVAWDLRGHGESSLEAGVRFTAADALDDLATLLDDLRIERAVFVGHSLGGNLTQAYVRQYPERSIGMIVMDSTWNEGPLTAGERFALGLAAPALNLVPTQSLARLMARASAVSPDAVARAKATFERIPKRVFLDVWRATVSLVRPDPSYRSRVPLALMRGAEDRTGNIAVAMRRWAQAEGVGEYIFANAGHILTWDAPESTSTTLLRVLETWGVSTSAFGKRPPC